MRFGWDEAKNRTNQRKHGVSFETACDVFDDPLHLSIQDRIEGGEERWQTMGMVGGIVLLIVAHTYRDDGNEEVIRGSFRHEKPHEENGAPMKAGNKRTSELKRLAAMPDAEIDTSDLPERKDWSRATVGKFYRPIKTQVTLRIDADVLDWFKAQGGKYQTALNSALREHVARRGKKVGRRPA